MIINERIKLTLMKLDLVAAGVVAGLRERDLSRRAYRAWFAKMMETLRESGIDDVHHTGKAFLNVNMSLLSDRLRVDEDPTNPVLIVVVKDDLMRMKLLFAHYRKIGVNQFVVLDNGSTDGTAEFCSAQPDTRVYRVDTPYVGNRKEGWVERAISKIGVDRWYIVADSDELLDYPGSETHPVQELIREQERLGNERLYGYMLDMYSDQPLYSVTCDAMDIPRTYCWFDRDTYAMDEALHGQRLPMGGPRQRLVGGKFWAGKCPVFCFHRDMSVINAHFLYPLVDITETNFCVVLRHYKYLSTDRAVYQFRQTQAGGYGYTACEYAAINRAMEQDSQASMYFEGSVKYEDSYSLCCLPRLFQTFPREGQRAEKHRGGGVEY